MLSIIDYIIENKSPETPFIRKFYMVNIGKENNYDYDKESIGDVSEVSYKFFSKHCKDKNGKIFSGFTFGKPTQNGDNWKYAMDISISDNDSQQSFNKFIDKFNKEDKFYQLSLTKTEAEQIANKAKNDYKKQKWTLESLLKAIKNDKDLMSLKYDFHIANVATQVDKNTVKSIYVSGNWKINVEDNKILVTHSGWRTYEVPNLQSLYKVLNANSDSDKDETIRCGYSKII